MLKCVNSCIISIETRLLHLSFSCNISDSCIGCSSSKVVLFSVGQVQLGLSTTVHRLKSNAVPTVFKHSESQAPKRRLHSEERLKKKHRSSARSFVCFVRHNNLQNIMLKL